MSPFTATCVCVTGVIGLFWLNHDKKAHTSPGLWIAVVWFFFCCSRSLSQWLGLSSANYNPMDGSPLDRAFYLALIVVAGIVLLRRRRVRQLLRANLPIVLIFLYAAISILWSGYPDIAFKRWIKSIGDLIVVGIVITDRAPDEALKQLFSKTGFLLIPFSVLLIKYFPDMGRQYDRWSGAAMYNGVALTKNDLGAICFLFGLSAVWQIIISWHERDMHRRMRILGTQSVILLMIAWLFTIIDSMTSLWCFLLGLTVLIATSYPPIARRPSLIHLTVGSVVLIPFSILFLHFGLNFAHEMTGRNIQTLTTRTQVWASALQLQGNSLVGTGFQSFWLGDRLKTMWSIFWWQPNEAHNGYLGVYLNLGWLGISMLIAVIAYGYRSIFKRLRRHVTGSTLMLAFFATAMVYNFTESAFLQMMAPVWFVFLLTIMTQSRPGTPAKKPRVKSNISEPAHAVTV